MERSAVAMTGRLVQQRTDPAARRQTHDELLAMTQQLIAEYAGAVPAGTVIRCVARSREHMLRTGVREGVVAATESAARLRLNAIRSPRDVA